MSLPVIDADGHVIEDESIVDYIEEPYRSQASKRILTRVFPSLDHHHLGLKYLSEGAFGGGEPVTPEDWRSFVEEAGFECSVLYPTWGLAMGNISQPDWACAVAHAYNSWLHDQYLKDNPRLKGMALIPLQHPEEAVKELRRAVTELGMLGAMLPSRGLPMDLGHRTYWAVYEEAERLGCGLAVHGGCHHGMGLDTFEAFVPIAGLGHPFSLMIAFSGMVYHGVFDRFPNLRVAFLEGGAGWLSFWMDRMDRCHEYFGEWNSHGNYHGPDPEHHPSQYGRLDNVFVGCEGGETGLDYQIQRAGNGRFLFASDFPHEIGPGDIGHEIAEVAENPTLTDDDKAAILAGNARRFYRLGL